jgi:hypothetical protein
MNQDQALVVIKQVLDAACKSGVFDNMESAATAANAYNVVFEALRPNSEGK